MNIEKFNIPGFQIRKIHNLNEVKPEHFDRLLPVFGLEDFSELHNFQFLSHDSLYSININNQIISYIRTLQEEFGNSIHGCNIIGSQFYALKFWKLLLLNIFDNGQSDIIFTRCNLSNTKAVALILGSGFLLNRVNLVKNNYILEFTLTSHGLRNSKLALNESYRFVRNFQFIEIKSHINSLHVKKDFHLEKLSIFDNYSIYLSSSDLFLFVIDCNANYCRLTILFNSIRNYYSHYELYYSLNEFMVNHMKKFNISEIRLEKISGLNLMLIYARYTGENIYYWIYKL